MQRQSLLQTLRLIQMLRMVDINAADTNAVDTNAVYTTGAETNFADTHASMI